MLWYFKNRQAYDYSTSQLINNTLTSRFHKCIYEQSDEMELYYSLNYMKENNIPAITVVCPLEELSVNYGNNNDINKKYCDSHSILYRYENRSGGCMVLFPGNIIIHDVRPAITFTLQYQFLEDFANWLKSLNIDNVEATGNDVLINDKKVIGAVSESLLGPYLGLMFCGISISINSDIELIDNICTKEMVKIPGALSDYGITTEEVMQWTLDWFDKHQYTE